MQNNHQGSVGGLTRLGDLVEKVVSANLALSTNPVGNWEDIVGKIVARHSKPVKFNRGKLTVHVYDSIWKHHLLLNKEEIIAKINRATGQELVRDIIFKVGDIESETDSQTGAELGLVGLLPNTRRNRRKTSKRRKRKVVKFKLSEDSKRFISSLKDPELKTIARRFLRLFPP